MTLDMVLVQRIAERIEAWLKMPFIADPVADKAFWKTGDPLEFRYGYQIGYSIATFTELFLEHYKRPPEADEEIEIARLTSSYSERIKKHLMRSKADSEAEYE